MMQELFHEVLDYMEDSYERIARKTKWKLYFERMKANNVKEIFRVDVKTKTIKYYCVDYTTTLSDIANLTPTDEVTFETVEEVIDYLYGAQFMVQNELKEMPLLIAKIEEWSKLRGINKLPYQEQRYKIMEEFGELFGAYYRGNTLELKDSLGDIVVTLIIYVQQFSKGERNFFEEFWWVDKDEFKGLSYHLDQIATSTNLIYAGASGIWVLHYVIADLKHIAKHYGWNLTECVEHAWEEIKDRKGQVVDGKWVKEKDLKDATN